MDFPQSRCGPLPAAAIAAGFLIIVAGASPRAQAALLVNFNLATDQNGGGPVPASAAANITNAVNAAVGVFNEWSDYNRTINVYYNSGVATADAAFNGPIRFGASSSYHSASVAWHEMLHVMGSGTYGTYWDNLGGGVWTGAQGIAMTRQYFPNNTLVADNHVHWVGGGTVPPEQELSRQGVHIMGAMRADMGLSNGNLYELLGDFNDNGSIGMEDYTTLVTNLHTDVSGLSQLDAFTRGDMNGNRLIDYADFAAFRTAYDAAHGAGAFELAIGAPEPTAIRLIALALIGVVGWGRFPQRSRQVARL